MAYLKLQRNFLPVGDIVTVSLKIQLGHLFSNNFYV